MKWIGKVVVIKQLTFPVWQETRCGKLAAL